jgi:shikimate dehydrogenase
MSSLFDFDAPPDRYAVMGNPVSHSKSPQIHSAFARQTGQRLEYTAIQVDAGGLEQAVGNFRANGGKGLNITVPFKQDAWRLVDTRSPAAEQAGAVNTIVFRDNGGLHGDNTDGTGLVRDITDNNHITIHGKRLLLMGAGGAARGVLRPLLDEAPENLVIVNRTADRAISLAAAFQPRQQDTATDGDNEAINGCGYDELPGQQFDLVINATAASLHGELPPLPDGLLADGACCYDMMYGDEPTVFLRWAQAHGAVACVDGLGMLVEQAAAAFELWRGVRPDSRAVIAILRGKQV